MSDEARGWVRDRLAACGVRPEESELDALAEDLPGLREGVRALAAACGPGPEQWHGRPREGR